VEAFMTATENSGRNTEREDKGFELDAALAIGVADADARRSEDMNVVFDRLEAKLKQIARPAP
jgi:hypothetical protein